MGRTREPVLEEGHEGHNVPVRWRWCILTIRHKPLQHHSPRAETMLDGGLHAQEGDVRADHESMGSGGGGARALPVAER
jgi:hypothetical protein